MAWYYGVFSCGHEGRTNIIGPTKNRQWIADRRFEGLCPECSEIERQKKQEEANKEAAKLALEQELPALEGSDKQIAWANTLRQKRIEEFEGYKNRFRNVRYERQNAIEVFHIVDNAKDIEKAIMEIEEIFQHILEVSVKASVWIDKRCYSIENLLGECRKNIAEKKEKEKEKSIQEEGLVCPDEVRFKGFVYIECTDSVIYAQYEKNDEFRTIMKKLGFEWNGRWEKQITEYIGDVKERMAEVGNTLLQGGFSISILDEEIRNNAIKGTFQAECKRWIKWNDDYQLSLFFDKNDRLYTAGMKIPSAKYRNGHIRISLAHFEELQDFAECFGFCFSSKSQSKIEEYKKKIKNTRKTTITPKVVEDEDKLKKILESSSVIIDDLREGDEDEVENSFAGPPKNGCR